MPNIDSKIIIKQLLDNIHITKTDKLQDLYKVNIIEDLYKYKFNFNIIKKKENKENIDKLNKENKENIDKLNKIFLNNKEIKRINIQYNNNIQIIFYYKDYNKDYNKDDKDYFNIDLGDKNELIYKNLIKLNFINIYKDT